MFKFNCNISPQQGPYRKQYIFIVNFIFPKRPPMQNKVNIFLNVQVNCWFAIKGFVLHILIKFVHNCIVEARLVIFYILTPSASKKIKSQITNLVLCIHF